MKRKCPRRTCRAPHHLDGDQEEGQDGNVKKQVSGLRTNETGGGVQTARIRFAHTNGKSMEDVTSEGVDMARMLDVTGESLARTSKSKALGNDIRVEHGCLLGKRVEWKPGFIVKNEDVESGLAFSFNQECACDDWPHAWDHQASFEDILDSTVYAVLEGADDIVVLNTAFMLRSSWI